MNDALFEELILSKNLASLDGHEFTYARNLKHIDIPDGIKVIGEYSLDSCSNLESIVLPASLTTVEWSAFGFSDKLSTVYYKGTEETWSNIEINNDMGRGEVLMNATRYYYSEEMPTVEGNWWHYDENGNPVVW